MHEAQRRIPNAAHESTDVGENFIWLAAAGMGALLVACALVVWWMYPSTRTDQRLPLPLPRYPEPRLQSRPTADMERFHAAEIARLNGSGWDDETRGLVHIPIADAMDRLAARGIPGWPAASGGPDAATAPTPVAP